MLNILLDHYQNYGSIPVSLVEHRHHAPPDRAITIFRQHNHDTLELLSIRQGTLRVICNGEHLVLHPGDHVFFNPYDAHVGGIEPEDGETHYICLMLESKLCTIGAYHTTLNRMLEEVRLGKSRFRTLYRTGEEGSEGMTEVVLALQGLYQRILSEQDAEGECLLMSELFRLLSILQKGITQTPPELLQNRDLHFIRQISDYVEKHYAAPITIESLCADLGYGQRNFYRLFRQNFAASFTEYLREYRIRRATELYRESDLSVSEIAAAVGFSDYCYFSRTFKKHVGESPFAYFRK